MLFGVISSDAAGSRVRGRAGSDLNGVVMFSLLIPFMIFIVYKLISQGTASFRQLLVIAVVFLLGGPLIYRSEEHTSELQSLMRISYAVFCLKKKKTTQSKLMT